MVACDGRSVLYHMRIGRASVHSVRIPYLQLERTVMYRFRLSGPNGAPWAFAATMEPKSLPVHNWAL
jgi:hypothetical protein